MDYFCMQTNDHPVFINNELPLFIHELRAKLLPDVISLLDLQGPEAAKCNTINIAFSGSNIETRQRFIRIIGSVLHYFDHDAAVNYSCEEYKEIIGRLLVFLQGEKADDLYLLPKEILRASVDMYVETLKLIRSLFNINFQCPSIYSDEWPPQKAIEWLKDPQQFSMETQKVYSMRAHIYDQLNEMYFSGATTYFAHTGHVRDTSAAGRGSGANKRVPIVHSAYLLAHHNSDAYFHSMRELSRQDGYTFSRLDERGINRRRRTDIDQIPTFLDNSAFELGESVSAEYLLQWYQTLRSENIIVAGYPNYEYVVILPDTLGDYDATINNSEAFIKKLSALRANLGDKDPFKDVVFHYMIVLQDKIPEGEVTQSSTVENRLESFKDLVSRADAFLTHSDSQEDKLWIGFPMMRYDNKGELQFDLQGSEYRAATINAVADYIDNNMQECNITIAGHLLGCVSPFEYSLLDEKGKRLVRSLDTSYPFAAGHQKAITKPFDKGPVNSHESPVDRPWNAGKKLRATDEKPFTLSIPLTTPETEEHKVHMVRHIWFQLESLNRYLHTLALNQRLFEEWVEEVWSS